MKRCRFSMGKPLGALAAAVGLALIPSLPASSDEQYGFGQYGNSNYVQATANNLEGDWMGFVFSTYTLHSDHWLEMWNYQDSPYSFTMAIYLDCGDAFGSPTNFFQLTAEPNGIETKSASLSNTFSTGATTTSYQVHAGTSSSSAEGDIQVVDNHAFVIVL